MRDDYASPIPKAYQWRTWAADPEGITGDALTAFVNDDLFPALKNLSMTGQPGDRRRVVRDVFEDAHNYMKSGQLMRQVVNKINEVDFNDAFRTAAFRRHLIPILNATCIRRREGVILTYLRDRRPCTRLHAPASKRRIFPVGDSASCPRGFRTAPPPPGFRPIAGRFPTGRCCIASLGGIKPVLRSLPGLARPALTMARQGRQAVRRLRRRQGGRDRRPHRRGSHGPDLRRHPGRLQLHLCRGDLDAGAARLDRLAQPRLRLFRRGAPTGRTGQSQIRRRQGLPVPSRDQPNLRRHGGPLRHRHRADAAAQTTRQSESGSRRPGRRTLDPGPPANRRFFSLA